MSRYTHNPSEFEEWRAEQMRPPDRYRRGQNPFLLHRDLPGDQSSEFSFGPGPVAPQFNGKTPEDGGVYRGRSPRLDPPPNGIGTPRKHRRPRSEASGNPGNPIAR